MKRANTLLLFLLLLLTGFAQNPFASYAYQPKMATLSNGRFDEFHDKDRIVEIGSVMLDTKTNKIVGTVKSDSAMAIQTVSRFISIDPHAERYYSISPYAYCNNNPVNCIDPDGKDWYQHNGNGSYYWQEGHDDLDGYTNVGSSVSLQLGKNSYFNAYQNAGVVANQAVNTFGLIASSTKLQNQFLGKNSPLSENSKSELFNGLVNRETSEIGRTAGQVLTSVVMSEITGALVGKVLSLSIGRVAGKVTTQFGSNANQAYHTFRHIDELGLDRNVVTQIIQKDFSKKSSQVISGQPFNSMIEVAGHKLQYTAYKLPNGTYNIGRIHEVKFK